MLLQISEPNSNDNVARERKRGLGIDLGTTNSLVATKSEQGADVICRRHRIKAHTFRS